LNLSKQQKDILVGLCLGELYIRKPNKNRNPWLRFEQGLLNKEYLYHLYDNFKEFCSTEPKIIHKTHDKITNKIRNLVYFTTRSLLCFNEFYDLFYHNGKIFVHLNIGELLTLIGLAYWILMMVFVLVILDTKSIQIHSLKMKFYF
jgi:LAGLIDADG DNA endonuclease family